ncbi:MAG: polyribonucleotide nucleotidyltransferase, partial [Bacilli bacterium]|nr:polyribonucleotide nucleotidyltransferase [Bacilli bacterium]
AIVYGHEAIKELIAFEEEIIAKVGKEKREVPIHEIPQSLREEVEAGVKERLIKAVRIKDKLENQRTTEAIDAEVLESYADGEYESDEIKQQTLKDVKAILEDIVRNEVRRLISVDKIRPDGRALDEIRPLNAQIDLLPRVHGSAMFTRGQTQVISICTLGPLSDSQIIENVTDETSRRFMHHYNFPPYSVGETGRMGNPGRREIGHGALGERALLQVLPDEKEFPYTIRCVAEVVESNGSSSQASICASCMALMAAGVPIKAPVGGIAIGLITSGPIDEGCPYTILTDI